MDPLFLVFFGLQRAYETIDHGCLMEYLKGYGAGYHMCRILAVFWGHKGVVTRQNGYHDP